MTKNGASYQAWPPGNGGMAVLVREYDWSATLLGPIESWPDRLKATVEQMLASPLISAVAFGPKRVLIYNDTAAQLYGKRHPAALGRPLAETFPGSFPEVAELYDRASAGESVSVLAQPLTVGTDGGEVFDAYLTPVRGTDGDVMAVHMVGIEIGDRVRAETASREAETRQRFLLKLIDALRPLADPSEIANTACFLLVEHLEGSRAQYAELSGVPGEETGEIRGEYVGSGDPMPRNFPLGPFGEPVLTTLRAGRTMTMNDADSDPRLDQDARDAFNAVDAPAVVSVPLVKGGRWLAAFTMHNGTPRLWSEQDIRMTEDVAERTWAAVERARAEAALRQSEQQLAAAFETVPVGAAVVDLSGTALLCNAEYRRFLPHGIVPSRDPERGERWQALDELGNVLAQENYPVARAMRGESIVPGQEMLYTDDDGREIWASVATVPTRDAAGRVNGIVTTISDIDVAKRSTEALRDSEERFAQFAKASSGGLWIRDAATLAMEYVSPAVAAIYGVNAEVVMGDIEKWAGLIVPEDRKEAIAHVERVRQGETVVHEFRVQVPSDHSFRWIRNVGFPLLDPQGNVQRIGGIFENVTQEKLTAEHQDILLAELQHRVRNIMAMIRSITARTADSVDSVGEYASLLSGRLLTLARVQALLTRAANAGVSLVTIVHDELNAQAIYKGQIDVEGIDVMLPPKAAETMTLAVHELATNALKYGALAAEGGVVSVRWTMKEKKGVPWLLFDWTETGAPTPAAGSGPRRIGFGSELIERRIPYELGGHGSLSIANGNAHCHLEFLLGDGASLLETDAPERFEVFGGAIDMRNAADLTGQCILITEDDYYLANDAARALRGAGADVIGPYPSENAARDAIAGKRLTGAILDINLNGGASFALAAQLRAEGVPFVFVTGYDQDIVPPDFRNVALLQKPVDYRRVVDTLATLIAAKG